MNKAAIFNLFIALCLTKLKSLISKGKNIKKYLMAQETQNNEFVTK